MSVKSHVPGSPLLAGAPRRRLRVGRDLGLRVARLKLRSFPSEAGNAEGEAAVPEPRTALLPSELIQPGEIIILLIKPSPLFILLDSLRGLFALAVIFGLALALTNVTALGLGRRDLIVLCLALASMRLFWQFLEWLGRIYVLTDRRVIRVRGVLRVQVFEAQLKHIQHTTTYFSLRERLFGLGTIGFATASAAGSAEAFWRMIARPLDVHQIVIQAMNRYR